MDLHFVYWDIPYRQYPAGRGVGDMLSQAIELFASTLGLGNSGQTLIPAG